MNVKIRQEQPNDTAAIREVNGKAFEQPQEANLVDQLRINNAVTLSLVALVDNHISGHILFSPVRVESEDTTLEGAGLAPTSVLPEFQRKGIGSQLIYEGIQRLKGITPFIVVLGHAEYDPRFGFVTASRYGIQCEWEVPDEVFMILALDASQLQRVSGIARYRKEFKNIA